MNMHPRLATPGGIRVGICVVFGIFVLSRLLSLGSFPIFNDEALYVQYSQLISENWAQYKFISVDNVYSDWKPPLQYWIGSLFVDLSSDPLLSTRVASFLVSLVGFWALYWLVRRLFDERTALIAAALFTLCPPVLMYNNQFVAETYVISFALVFLWLVLEAARCEWRSIRGWGYIAGAAYAAAAVLLSKQSGALYLAIAPILVVADPRLDKRAIKLVATRLCMVAAICAAGYGLYRLVIPPPLFANEARFTGRWTLTAAELMSFPTDAWAQNASLIAGLYRSYYTLFAVPLILWAAGRAAWDTMKRRDLRGAAVLVSFLFSSAVVLFYLRRFNEYIYHTAAGVFLIMLLGLAVRDILDGVAAWRTSKIRARALAAVGAALAAGMLASWVYQDTLMATEPGSYIRRSTAWMRDNYLSSWPTGFGIPEIVAFLEAESGPGIVFVDPQWGNPGTSITIYRNRYPSIDVLPLQMVNLPTVQEALPSLTSRFVVFSEFSEPWRDDWMRQVQEKMCAEKTVFAPEPDQTPIIVCRF